MDRLRSIWRSLLQPYKDPTLKQLEAHGRFCHTLAGVCLAGAATIAFTDEIITDFDVFRISALLVSAILLFVMGSILSKGEK